MKPSLPNTEPLAPSSRPIASQPKSLPICLRCPECGCPDFDEARPDSWIAFKQDRLCVKCHKRYALPTPGWARIVFYIAGGLLVVVFGGSIVLSLLFGNSISLFTNIPLVLLGIASIGFAVRAGQQQVLTAPEWEAPPREQPKPRPSTPAEKRSTIIVLATVALFIGGIVWLWNREPPNANNPNNGGFAAANGAGALPTTSADDAIAKLQALGGMYGGEMPIDGGSLLHLWKMQHQITDDELALVQDLVSLRCLNVASTEITDAGVVHLAKLKNLDRLVFNCEQITDAGVASLPALPRLTCLHLRRTQITDAALGKLPNLAGLKDLDLMFTEVTDEGVAKLAPAKNLETLNLTMAPVTAQGFAGLGNLHKLTTLVLDFTEVGDEGFENFLALRGLKELLLDRTNITDASVPVLKQMKGLKLLGVGGTGLTREGVVEIKRALPKCWVTTTVGEPEDEEQ